MTERACSILLAHDDLVLRLSLRQVSKPPDDLLEDVVVVDVLSVPLLPDVEAAAVRNVLNDPVILEEVIKRLSGGSDQVGHARRPSKLL
jgi:hypothetical protein